MVLDGTYSQESPVNTGVAQIMLELLLMIISVILVYTLIIWPCSDQTSQIWLLNLNQGLSFCSKLDLGCYIAFIAKTTSKKGGALICSMSLLLTEVALSRYKSILSSLLVFHLYLFWTIGSLLKYGQPKVFSKSVTVVGAHLNWLKWFHFFIPVAVLLVFLIAWFSFSPGKVICL